MPRIDGKDRCASTLEVGGSRGSNKADTHKRRYKNKLRFGVPSRRLQCGLFAAGGTMAMVVVVVMMTVEDDEPMTIIVGGGMR